MQEPVNAETQVLAAATLSLNKSFNAILLRHGGIDDTMVASVFLQLLQKRRHGLRASIAASSQSSPTASDCAATKANVSETVRHVHQSRTSRITASMGAAIFVVGDGRLLGRRYSRLQQVTGGG